MGKVRIFDPVAGGEALVVLDVGDEVASAGSLRGPGDGRAAARVRVGRDSDSEVLVFDPVAGGDPALLVLDIGVGGEAHWRSSRTQRRGAEARVRL